VIICKDFDMNKPITSLNDWYNYCPPVKGKVHWKNGRSAMELAKDWINNNGKDLEGLLGSTTQFSGITFKMASPEFKSKFDEFKGNTRQHDLLVLASQNNEEILISIEAKADEPFGKIIKDYYLNQIIVRINGKRTFVPNRIENLIEYVFGNNITVQVFNLRYQLLHAIAGTIAEAKRRNIKKAIFVVNTYCSSNAKLFSQVKHQENMKDLNQFVGYLSKNTIKVIGNDQLIGPFKIQGVDLYIIKRKKLCKYYSCVRKLNNGNLIKHTNISIKKP